MKINPLFFIVLVQISLLLNCDTLLAEEIESGEKVYRVPEGGLFKYITNPSYFSELLSFAGFAIATWSLGAVFVLVVSAANLIPRAFQVHRWYQAKFPDYPSERKVLIPFVV